MSANAESQTPQQPGSKKGKRKGALLLLTLLFIIVAVAYGIYWFLVLRHFEETDDAYVAGNQVQIMAQVSGSVTKVWADNTDYVQKGDPLVTLDQTDAQQAFEKAQTQLAASVRQTRQQMINSKQLQASIDVKKPRFPRRRPTLTVVFRWGRQPDWPRRAAARARHGCQRAGRTGRGDSAIQRQSGDRSGHEAGTAACGAASGHRSA